MAQPVKFNDIIEALETAGEDFTYYLDKRSGEIVLITNGEMEAAEGNDLDFGLSRLAARNHIESR